MSAALHRWLDAEVRQAPEFLDARRANLDADPPGGGAYSNHRPMALQALAALGASAAQLDRFMAGQAPQPARVRWPALDQAEQPLRQRLRHDGAAAVLAALLPERLHHAGAVAFHGLIRSAHAFESAHADELALALAWWQQRDQALQPVAAPQPERDLVDWVEALLALPAPLQARPDWISARMQAWDRAPGVAAACAALRLQADSLQQLAAWALRAYAGSGNFTLLHLVTASRALAVLGPCLPPAACEPALRAFSHHAGLAILASGWRGQADGTALSPGDALGEPRAAALQTDEAHTIKLVHAALDWQSRGLPAPLCQAAAARALRG